MFKVAQGSFFCKNVAFSRVHLARWIDRYCQSAISCSVMDCHVIMDKVIFVGR